MAELFCLFSTDEEGDDDDDDEGEEDEEDEEGEGEIERVGGRSKNDSQGKDNS